MGAAFFLVIVGLFVGAACGAFGAVLAMMIAGGGHSHSDMFVPIEAAIVGAGIGAVVIPRLAGAALGALERRRVDGLNGATPASLVRPVACLVGSLWAGFVSFASFYHSTAIATLAPEAGGPTWNPHPVARVRLTQALGVLLSVLAVRLFVSAVRLLRAQSVGRPGALTER